MYRWAALMRVCRMALFTKGFGSVLQVLGSVLDGLDILGSFLNLFGGIIDGFGGLVGDFLFGCGNIGVYSGGGFYGCFGSGLYGCCAVSCSAVGSVSIGLTIAASGETQCCKSSGYIKHLFHNLLYFSCLFLFLLLFVCHCVTRHILIQK